MEFVISIKYLSFIIYINTVKNKNKIILFLKKSLKNLEK